MEQETAWHSLRRAIVTNTLQRIRMRERSFPRLSKRYRPLAAIAHARIRKISVICSRVSRRRRPGHLNIEFDDRVSVGLPTREGARSGPRLRLLSAGGSKCPAHLRKPGGHRIVAPWSCSTRKVA